MVLFARSHVLLDNQASVNVFCDANLLTNIRRSKHGILLNGVQAQAVPIDLEGDFGEVGLVYYSQRATANIPSFAAMVDRGADIRYSHSDGRFTLQPRGSSNIYSFCRRPVPGSEGRFYVCDVKSMVKRVPTQHRGEMVLVNTVSENMSRFTKREIASAAKARELVARMGYPPVEMVIAMVRGGNNFRVSENDFRIAHSIWGEPQGQNSQDEDAHSRHHSIRSISTIATDFGCGHCLYRQHSGTYRSFHPSGPHPLEQPHSV